MKRKLCFQGKIFLLTLSLVMLRATGAQAIRCYECHGAIINSTAGDYRPIDDTHRNISTGGIQGNHRTHMDADATALTCSKCHPGSGSYTSRHSRDSNNKIKVSSRINASTLTTKYKNTTSAWLQTVAPVLGTCTNVNCHFESTTPTWGSDPALTTCTTCHGIPPAGYTAPYGGGAAGSHGIHNEYYPGVNNCIKCHADHTVEATPFAHATSIGNRGLIIRPRDPLNNIYGSFSAGTRDYLPSQVGTHTYGTCMNTYCHSSGISVATGTIPANTSPVWGSGVLACNDCHGNMSYSDSRKAFPLYTSNRPNTKANSHKAHLAFNCEKCHYNTTTDGIIITNTANHVDKTYNVNAGSGGASFTYTYNSTGGSCSNISCHFDNSAQWGITIACGGCHPFTNATMISGSHATHLAELKGPNGVVSTTTTCDSCHGTGATAGTHAGHGNGVVAFADGNILASTNACNTCHSLGGPYNGVDDASIGAKPNWSFRVYTGSSLKSGKERWCLTCHDSGTSLIRGRQAPDLAGNNTSYGYYVAGHGIMGTECGSCHGLDMNHKIDGKKTFAAVSSNYKLAYRLKDVGGMDPMKIPAPATGGVCSYNADDYKLCYSCHNEQSLLKDTRAAGVWGCANNPFKSQPIATLFRNDNAAGLCFSGCATFPANIHWDHLVDADKFLGSNFWNSDGRGAVGSNSRNSCVTCHNPHGDSFGAGVSTVRMTRGDFQVTHGTDGNGEYGQVAGASAYDSSRCAIACHGAGTKYYRADSLPLLDSITAVDNNPADPAPAEAGYTNARAVTITITTSGAAPTQMILAEDAAFTVNSTGWIAYAGTYTHTLTAGDGSKTVYGKLKNASGGSSVRSATIVLDQSPPTVPATTATAPNGAEQWDRGTTQNITWGTGGMSDANLKASPVSIDYSTDSGASYPNAIASGVANSGTYSWPIPASLTSTQARVRVTATDRAGNQASDASNADFTIKSVTSVLSGITVADNNSADPAPADPGYTNNQTIAVTLTAANNPDQMMFAEDAGFTTNSTGWIAYAGSYDYTLTAGDGSKTVYAKVQNGAGPSATQSAAIILDTAPPAIPATTLTAPNGGEAWTRGSSQTITWGSGAITDANLKDSPITIEYSTDGGATWPNTLVNGIANSGSLAWNPLPSTASHTARVRIKATDRAGNRSSDSSDNDFYISTPYIVTNTADSGAGSLRQAISDVISAGGNNAIWFNIPVGSLTNGVAVISPATNLPVLSQSGISIDGGSQTSLVGNTNPNGPEVRIAGTSGVFGSEVAFDVTAANATIKNVQLVKFNYAVRTNSANTVIDGNQIGFSSASTGTYSFYSPTYNGYAVFLQAGSTNATIGGSAGNMLSCNYYQAIYDAGSGNRIMNNIIGLLPNGTLCGNNKSTSDEYGIKVTSATGTPITNCLIQGNTICGDVNSNGIYLDQRVEGCSIKGNIFGLRYSGGTWTQIGALSRSIDLYNVNNGNNTIGGPNMATSDAVLNDSNIINSGNISTGAAIYLRYNNSLKPVKIFGNFIGTNPEKTRVFNGTYGVRGISPYNSVIGGDGAGEAGNVIANMSTYGVYLENSAVSGVKISRNSFYNNGTSVAGSDDAIKMVAGANGGVTRPVITAATTTAITVDGAVAGDTVEVYISDYIGSGTPYGEGKTFVGSAVVTSGTSVVVPVTGVSSGAWVTAIRIKATHDTSPFSANVSVP